LLAKGAKADNIIVLYDIITQYVCEVVLLRTQMLIAVLFPITRYDNIMSSSLYLE